MKKYLISLAAVALAACGGGELSAATIYVSACATGADPSCVAGSDSNSGTVSTSPRLTISGGTNGDTFLIARGAALESATSFVGFANTSNSLKTTVSDFTPTWCTGGCTSQKPILRITAVNVIGFNFQDGGNADKDCPGLATGGTCYELSNLDIRGPGYAASGAGTGHGTGAGVFVYNDADGVLINNVSINGFNIGVHMADFGTVNAGANNSNEYFTLKNSTIQNNAAQGLLGGGAWLLVENNVFDYNGFAAAIFDHNIYIGTKSTNPVAKGIIIRGNTLTNNAIVSGTCQSVALVAHSNTPDMIIENNTIIDTSTSATCFGIDVNADSGGASTQSFARVIIRGNKLVVSGSASQGIGCSACPNALIENNIIIRLGGTGGFIGINVPSSGTYRDDPTDGDAVIRNNSIYIDASSTGAVGIQMASTTTGETVASNVIVFSSASSTSAKCFNFGTRAIGTFTAFDYNSCYRPSADATWSGQHSTLATAQAASFDTNSSKADPGMTTPAASDYLFEASSGAAAVINAASPTYKSRYGYRGKTLNGARDRGACEYRAADACSAASASVPSSATGLR